MCGAYYDRVDPHFLMRTWAHNLELSTLAELGPLGLLALGWLLFAAFRLVLRSASPYALGGLATLCAWLTIAQFHDVIYDTKVTYALWFALALAAGGVARPVPAAPAPRVASGKRSQRRQDRRRPELDDDAVHRGAEEPVQRMRLQQVDGNVGGGGEQERKTERPAPPLAQDEEEHQQLGHQPKREVLEEDDAPQREQDELSPPAQVESARDEPAAVEKRSESLGSCTVSLKPTKSAPRGRKPARNQSGARSSRNSQRSAAKRQPA